MKSRYKKYLRNLVKKAPIIAFSIEDVFLKNQMVTTKDFSNFSYYLKYGEFNWEFDFRNFKREAEYDYAMFLDNYLICGGNKFVYILEYKSDGEYKIVEKENKLAWRKSYWDKEDPHNEREWAYIDEDVYGLFKYIDDKFKDYI